MSRALVVALLAVLLLAAGCGGDDENGGDEEQADTTTEETTEQVYPTASPSGQVAEPAEIPRPRPRSLREAADAARCKLEDPSDAGRAHVDPGMEVEYESNPPTSGDHWPFAAEDGAYSQPPRYEELVHSLEHGRIVVLFGPELDEEAKGGLQALFEENDRHMLLSPSPGEMPYAVAATAWNHLLGCQQLNDRVYDAIRAFRDRYRDKGPENVP